MGAKKAKLNLDFGYSGVRMNIAAADDIQPRYGKESDWRLVSIYLDFDSLEDFHSESREQNTRTQNESRVRQLAMAIESKIEEWQNENGYDFDPVAEITISAAYFDVLSFSYAPGSKEKIINEDDVKKMELCKHLDVASQIRMPNETIKIFISPYFLISRDGKDFEHILDPIGQKAMKFGFQAYFITENSTISKIIKLMETEGDRINVSLSCEKEFKALASDEEKRGKTLLINLTDSISEFSIWDNSQLKYLNKREIGLKELRHLIWRLCLCYHRIPEMSLRDYELTQSDSAMKDFYERVKNIDISPASRELLSADDCVSLLEYVSCVLESETVQSAKTNRLALPGRGGCRTNSSISNYVLSYFTREAIRSILNDIKRTIEKDDFCEYEYVILDCNLPLKGINKLAKEVFWGSKQVKRGVVKWDGEIKEDFSIAGIGALKDLISGEVFVENRENKKKTSKLLTFWDSLFKRAQ